MACFPIPLTHTHIYTYVLTKAQLRQAGRQACFGNEAPKEAHGVKNCKGVWVTAKEYGMCGASTFEG